MREIPATEVRAGDIARSNGKELRVVGVSPTGRLIRCEDGDQYTFQWTPEALAVLGVTFWREERVLPDYPGAVVISSDGHRYAVRACVRGENVAPWLTTTASVPWKTDPELLEWLGPDWEETTTPPAREWTPVDADQIRTGDFARFEWEDGDAVEGLVDVGARRIRFYPLDVTVSAADLGEWFKREARTT